MSALPNAVPTQRGTACHLARITHLEDELLGKRLVRMTRAAIDCGVTDAHGLFGWPDEMKFRSCMTLFEAASPGKSVFGDALELFFHGRRCEKTLNALNLDDR